MKINWKSKILACVTSLMVTFGAPFCVFSLGDLKLRSSPDYKYLNMFFYLIGDINRNGMISFFGNDFDFAEEEYEFAPLVGGGLLPNVFTSAGRKCVKTSFIMGVEFEFSDVESYICKFIKKHPDLVDVFLVDGRYLLHCAIEHNSKAMFDCLIDLNADVNCTDITGNTPLILALRADSFNMARSLIDKNADVDCVDGRGNAALILALRNDDLITARALLERGASPNCKDESGCPCLVLAARKKRDDIVALLLEYHANPDSADSGGCTPLFEALDTKNLSIFRRLLKAGADVNLEHSEKLMTPLYFALHGLECSEESIFVRELRDHGAYEVRQEKEQEQESDSCCCTIM